MYFFCLGSQCWIFILLYFLLILSCSIRSNISILKLNSLIKFKWPLNINISSLAPSFLLPTLNVLPLTCFLLGFLISIRFFTRTWSLTITIILYCSLLFKSWLFWWINAYFCFSQLHFSITSISGNFFLLILFARNYLFLKVFSFLGNFNIYFWKKSFSFSFFLIIFPL